MALLNKDTPLVGGLLENPSQTLGLLAMMPTFSGRQNPLRQVAPYFLNKDQREREAKRAQMQQKLLQQQIEQNQRKTQQAQRQGQLRQRAAGLLDPNFAVPGDANMPAQDPNVPQNRRGLLDQQQRGQGLLSTGVQLGDANIMSLGQDMTAPPDQSRTMVVSGEKLGIGQGNYEVKLDERGRVKDINSLGGQSEFDMQIDQFGNIHRINRASGNVETMGRIPTGGQAQSPTQQPPSRGRPIGDAISEGTGPFASIKSGISNLVGPFVEGSMFPETESARSQIRLFNQNAKTALVNNPRFPVAEQKIIQRMLPDPDKMLTDPDAERQKLNELRQHLTSKKQANQQAIQSGNITQKEVGSLSNQNASIDRVIQLMGGNQNRFIDMSPQELDTVNVDQLSNDELDAYIQALEGGR